MSDFAIALWVEALKVRRSKAPWVTALASLLLPAAGGLFMLILKDPEWALRSGLISSKARLTVGTADWPSYFQFLAQAVSAGGLILFGLVFVWIFGREHSDHTAKDLLALPVARWAIVLGKFVVAGLWSALLAVIILAGGVFVGAGIGLPGWSGELLLQAGSAMALGIALSVALAGPFALVASAGRGYLPGVGGMFLVLFFTQIVLTLGWGAYFPWAVPLLMAGAVGAGEQVGVIGFVLVALTCIAGVAGTLAWWQVADQT